MDPQIVSPLTIIRDAMKAVPQVKWALAVAALVSVVALVYGFNLDPRVAFVGTIAILCLMGVFVVFARMAALDAKVMRAPAVVFTWFVLLTFMLFVAFIASSIFFDQPLPLGKWLVGKPQEVTMNQDQARAICLSTVENFLRSLPEYGPGYRLSKKPNATDYKKASGYDSVCKPPLCTDCADLRTAGGTCIRDIIFAEYDIRLRYYNMTAGCPAGLYHLNGDPKMECTDKIHTLPIRMRVDPNKPCTWQFSDY